MVSEFAERSPQLFARFIPNMLPATQPQDLPFLMEQTQQMQEELAASQGFTRYLEMFVVNICM